MAKFLDPTKAEIVRQALKRLSKQLALGTRRLQGAEIARIIKWITGGAGPSAETVSRMSRHSSRVGTAQDLVAFGAHGRRNAGRRWKSPQMPERYSEWLGAEREAVARLYERPTG